MQFLAGLRLNSTVASSIADGHQEVQSIYSNSGAMFQPPSINPAAIPLKDQGDDDDDDSDADSGPPEMIDSSGAEGAAAAAAEGKGHGKGHNKGKNKNKGHAKAKKKIQKKKPVEKAAVVPQNSQPQDTSKHFQDGQDAQSPESQGSQPQDSEPQEHELKPPKGDKKDKMPAEQAKLIKKATASLDLLAKITEDWHDAGTKLPKERSQPTITAPA